jgi:predicted ArsR family transcriptional regulator
VCTMEKLMLSEILGNSVRLSECRLDGASCCTFTPSAS